MTRVFHIVRKVAVITCQTIIQVDEKHRVFIDHISASATTFFAVVVVVALLRVTECTKEHIRGVFFFVIKNQAAHILFFCYFYAINVFVARTKYTAAGKQMQYTPHMTIYKEYWTRENIRDKSFSIIKKKSIF